jgi:hypothetical protein
MVLWPKGACRKNFSACEIERRPRGASRGKPAPTFVSGQYLLHPLARGPLFARRDIEWYAKGYARQCLRNDWPETNVGAGLPREAPRGRRSVSQALKS